MTISTRLCLHAADVTLVLDAPAVSCRPSCIGAPLSATLSEADTAALAACQTAVIPNGPTVRVALVPEGAPAGRGVRGAGCAGRDWTPMVLSGVTIDAHLRPSTPTSPCLVVFEAADADASPRT